MMFIKRLIAVRSSNSKLITRWYSVKEKFRKRDELCGVVGLEVHAQINSSSKLFSGASTDYTSLVNQNVAMFDAAIPGTLPALNRKCVEAGVLTALALNCTLNPVSSFDRKHYFYADLPAGYQITQQRSPLARGGTLSFQVFGSKRHDALYSKKARIHQLQLEQDSGKSIHDEQFNRSLVDLNRAGIPLMEIVFEPDLSNGEEAAALVKELIQILTCLNTCLCKMEEGGLRIDANVSVHQHGTPFGVRTEVKNIGSVRGMAKAVDYEIERQRDILLGGGVVVNETRSWDAGNNCTVPMRDKEEKQDYRFMPEPNLPPVRLDMDGFSEHPDMVSVPHLTASLPELPHQTRLRLQSNFGLRPLVADSLVSNPKLLTIFESVMDKDGTRNPVIVANLLANELCTLVNKEICTLESSRPSADDMGEIADLLQSKQINLLTGRHVLECIATGESGSATSIVKAQDLFQITDPIELKAVCEAAISRNPAIVKLYQSGQTKVMGALLGDVAESTNKRADMAQVAKLLKELLGPSS